MITVLLLAVPAGHADHPTSCQDATAFGDGSVAACDLHLPICGSSCITYDLTITVTTNGFPNNIQETYVEGVLAGMTLCGGWGGCTGTHTVTQHAIVSGTFPCEGHGLLPNVATSLQIRCDRTVA